MHLLHNRQRTCTIKPSAAWLLHLYDSSQLSLTNNFQKHVPSALQKATSPHCRNADFILSECLMVSCCVVYVCSPRQQNHPQCSLIHPNPLQKVFIVVEIQKVSYLRLTEILIITKEQKVEWGPIHRIYTCPCHFTNNFVSLKRNQRWIYNILCTSLLFRVTELLNT